MEYLINSVVIYLFIALVIYLGNGVVIERNEIMKLYTYLMFIYMLIGYTVILGKQIFLGVLT